MRGKHAVERAFGALRSLLFEQLPGYTGVDVADRAVWSLPDLQELLDEWIICGWQSRPHEGLRHPFTPDRAAGTATRR